MMKGPQGSCDAGTSEGAPARTTAAPSDDADEEAATVGGGALDRAGAAARAAPAAAAASTSAPVSLPLELGWTRVKRKRRRQEREAEKPSVKTSLSGDSCRNTSDGNEDGECWDCMDPNCRRKTSPSFQPRPAGNRETVVKGRVVWLLHDVESVWFQGYLLVPGHARPWGLLAILQEIDECLQCSEGGYRQIKLIAQRTGNNEHKMKKVDFGLVDWTGGDMMRLESANVKMEPESIVTGDKAAAITMDLFKGLWKRLLAIYSHAGQTDDIGLLDLLPDVAVVHGTMELVEPTEME